uniref:Uncharacterized protein n=1 Tax=viral metagenome TaxID=1070528 RepID=A0A6C0LF96_9ZZZZ
MERRINKRIEGYITTFKDELREKILNFDAENEMSKNQLIQYIYDYERLTLEKDDFMKRKRVKNVVPFFDRCCAKRANGEQCTRRKKEGDEYCGTHMKGTPHGVAESQNEVKDQNQKIEVWAQDIQGIIYYIDKTGNVYQAEDIISNKTNPKIIAKYIKTGEIFSIPQFGI